MPPQCSVRPRTPPTMRPCVRTAKVSEPILILPPKRAPLFKATRKLRMRAPMHIRLRPHWRFPWERLTPPHVPRSEPPRRLRLLSIHHQQKARVVARERTRHELKGRRTRNGLSRIPQSGERQCTPTATHRPGDRGPVRAIPCRYNDRNRQEARKDEARRCRDARAYGRLDDLVAKLV